MIIFSPLNWFINSLLRFISEQTMKKQVVGVAFVIKQNISVKSCIRDLIYQQVLIEFS